MDNDGLDTLLEKSSVEIGCREAKNLSFQNLNYINLSPLSQGAETKACSSEEQSPDDETKTVEHHIKRSLTLDKRKKTSCLLNDDAELFRLSEMIDPMKSLRHALSLHISESMRKNIKEKTLSLGEDILQKIKKQNVVEDKKEDEIALSDSDTSSEESDSDEKKDCLEEEMEMSNSQIAESHLAKVEERSEANIDNEDVGKTKTGSAQAL